MIRAISVADAESLAEVHKNCFDESWSAQAFRDMLSLVGFFGFATASPVQSISEIAGFALGKMICDEVEIITLCVLPQFRNRKMGKALLNKVAAHAESHSAREIFLEVAEDNLIARKMYQELGYESISRRKQYYGSGDSRKDAIVMRLREISDADGSGLS
jgi:ribosomal-protein-alanine N-acetyltransferase